MGTSGAPTTILSARGRSAKVLIDDARAARTITTGSLQANTEGETTSPCAASASMCLRSAEAKTSAAAPCSICARSSWLPAALLTTLTPGWSASNRRASRANASLSDAASKTTSSPAGDGR